MTTTNFIDGSTTVVADWLNDVDAHVYNQDVDPHPQYTTSAEATALSANAINAHVALSDPHTQYTQDTQLAATSGSTLIGFLQNGSGAVPQTIQTKLQSYVSVDDFGAVGDGTTNDSAAFQAALNAGVFVTINASKKYYLATDITIPTGKTLLGGWDNPDLYGNPAAPTYNTAPGIRLASTASINLGQSATIKNMLIYRSGMTFPVLDDSLYAGTAIRATGVSQVKLENLLVLGFANLFVGTGQRYVLDRVYGDNKNGIDISGSPDVCYISRCHMWPFAADTITYPNAAANRSGTAFKLHDTADWAKITDCFSYAYSRGFHIINANSVTLTGCGADHNYPNSQGGSIGFLIEGTSKDVKLIGCQSAAQIVGYQIDTSSGNHTELLGCQAWSNTNHNVLIQQGAVSVVGGILRDAPTGVAINHIDSLVVISEVRFYGISTLPISYLVSTGNVMVGLCDYGNFADGTVTSNNKALRTVASAGNLLLPANHSIFTITGTTNISFISGWWTGREITLIFSGTLTVANGGGGQLGILLSGGANFSAVANSTLTLIHNGSTWLEKSRKV